MYFCCSFCVQKRGKSYGCGTRKRCGAYAAVGGGVAATTSALIIVVGFAQAPSFGTDFTVVLLTLGFVITAAVTIPLGVGVYCSSRFKEDIFVEDNQSFKKFSVVQHLKRISVPSFSNRLSFIKPDHARRSWIKTQKHIKTRDTEGLPITVNT